MPAANKETTNGTLTTQPELDIEKLHALPSEQQDLYLLTFTSDLSRHVATLDKDAAIAQQSHIKKEVFKIIALESPAPSRVIRNNLGQCLAGVLTKGDRKILFESVNELSAIISSIGKTDKDIRTRHAAAHLAGVVFEAAGDSAINSSVTASASLLKLLKPAQNHAGFRATLFRSMGRIVKGVGRFADEAVSRDVFKQARSVATSDKALLVQANACWCLQQLVENTSFFDNSSDFDKLQTALWKVMDSPSAPVRRAAAICLSASYGKNYSSAADSDTNGKSKKSKKAKNRISDEQNGETTSERTSSPAPQLTSQGLSFSLADVLRQLSAQYCRASTTNRMRSAIFHSYLRLFRILPPGVIEENYSTIALHFFNDLLSSPAVLNNRYRLLITRRLIHNVLDTVIGSKLLGEGGQIRAVQFLTNGLLKDYPQSDIKERPEPTKQALTGALDSLCTLIGCLGSALATVADICRSSLLQVLEHPSYTVQIHASRCLQAFVLACPQYLLPTATICMNSINREVGFLAGPHKSPRKCLGLAFGLSAVTNASASQPLYGSVEIYSRIFNQATGFLKSSSGTDLRVSATQIQVAWILIGGLMSLGPSFVKIHLSQLLLLWKNALPKPLGKNNAAQQGLLELSFLAHVRECALGALKAFFSFNGRLLTLDVSTRLASLLQNTAEFASSLPIRKATDDADKLLFHSIQLSDFSLMVQRRLFECYASLLMLSPQRSHESLLQTSVLSLAVSAFADPETLSMHSLTSSIATASGNFESIWEVGDSSGFGLTGLVQGLDTVPLFKKGIDPFTGSHWLSGKSDEAQMDNVINSPTCTAIEHDPVALYSDDRAQPSQPLATGVVDSAIRLFAISLPLQSSRVQQGVLEQISSQMASGNASQSPAREIAVMINVNAALLYALQVACSETSLAAGDIRSPRVEKSLQEILHAAINHQDHSLRNLAAEALGRLCKSSGSDFTGQEIKYLVERIVADREPNARSGCAMALGCISAEVGGMAAGLHLKNIVGILSSLALDPHPTVHFWAIEALSKIAEATGLSFSQFVTSSLGMMAQLYTAESHGDEGPSQASSNLEVELPSLAAIARCIHSLINVLGPDLQDMAKARNMILTLTYQFQTEASPVAGNEALKCLEALSLYASDRISSKPYLRQLQNQISSEDPDLRQTALTGLYNAMRKDAEHVVRRMDASFEEQLWLVLDQTYGTGVILDIIKDWVQQSGMSHVDRWVERIQAILKKTKTARKEVIVAAPTEAQDPDSIDEEVAGFAAAAAHSSKDDPEVPAEATQELLRWQVRREAMDALNGILVEVAKDVAAHGRSDAAEALQFRLSEVIRIAFSASTASVVELRIGGIQIIGRLLEIFGRVPDPDFPEVTLLEQYQAQISSALTPAFAADSSPALAAEAVNVCALFISTGIVTDKERMGRILRLLVSALEDFSKASETVAIGDLKGLSANAQVMVRLAVFSAWAELQNSSQDQKYLEEILRPHIAQLTPLWLSSLQEYARLKFEPDISTAGAGAPITGNLDDIYAALNRETLLAFYQASWLDFVEAIASLIDKNSELVFDALEGKSLTAGDDNKISNNDINYREEPVAFFFVLFGISFEALLAKSNDDPVTAQQRTLEILQALEKILRPSVAGNAIYQEAIFSETMDVFARLALTEGLEVQTVIVDIARNLCVEHPSARRSHDAGTDDNLSDDIDQLFELTRIIVLVVSKHVPISSSDTPHRSHLTEDQVLLILQSLTALVDAAAVFPSVIKSDLHACILHIFATLLSNAACQASLVPQALPILRGFVSSVAVSALRADLHHDESLAQLRGALARFMMIVKHAQRRENEIAPIAERNALLACTIVVTASAKAFHKSDPLITRFTEELADCLTSAATTKVAAGLSRSLLLLSSASAATTNVLTSPSEAHVSARMLPQLLSFIVTPSDIEGTAEARQIVSQSLTAFALSSASKPAAFALVIPGLLRRAQNEGQAVWRDTNARLMELASREAGAFRGIVAALSAGDRALLEEVIRSGVRLRSGGDEDASAKEPSIALKLDF